MTGIYLNRREDDEFSPEIFIGSLLTGGYGFNYCLKHNCYELIPQELMEGMIRTIAIGRKRGFIKPEEFSGEKTDLVQDSVNLVIQEIEKLDGEVHSESLNKRIKELISLFN